MTNETADSLKLEPLDLNLFRGRTPASWHGRVYGGQVVAQALLAAYATLEDRPCHSLHAYFERPGDPAVPIIFEVERSRDGGTFSTRRVVAIQQGKQILNLAASFQVAEVGLEHQQPAPAYANWRDLPDDPMRAAAEQSSDEANARRYMGLARALEIRRPSAGKERESTNHLWFRARDPIGPDPRLHQAMLAFGSDIALLSTAFKPHGVSMETPGMQTASLDHAMWFHRASDFNRWHLYAQDSPASAGARGFGRGMIYDETGTLIASTAQEGLLRIRTDGKGGLR